jgi:hypothetical protein
VEPVARTGSAFVLGEGKMGKAKDEQGDWYSQREARERLSKAAPDLLTALEACVKELESWEMDPETDTAAEPLKQAREALAKAKGAA